jgi:hypothetical protein
VLYATLQDAKKLHKWQKKPWRGVFLGFASHHSTNITLVLNTKTGNITPQYHVVFDEKFSATVSNVADDSATSAVNLWDTLQDEDAKNPNVFRTQVIFSFHLIVSWSTPTRMHLRLQPLHLLLSPRHN